MNIHQIKNEINNKIGSNTYYYISNDVEHSLGLESLINNLTVICRESSYISDYMRQKSHNVISVGDEDTKSSAQLLEYVLRNNLVTPRPGDFFQTFKISSQFRRKVEEIQGVSINTSDALNRLFENKSTQIQLFAQSGVSVPQYKIMKISDIDYQAITSELGENWVLQFNRGHTGSGTVFIKSEDQLDELKKNFPNREVKCSKFIPGETYTFNACFNQNRIFCAGLNRQITGIEGLTAQKGGTVGNNFNHGLDENMLKKIKIEVDKLTPLLNQNGYKGLFGIDFMIDPADGKIYFIEMNARQPMSTAFNSQLQQLNGQIPLSLLHTASFLNIELELDDESYFFENMKSSSALQLFLRNTEKETITIKSEIKTGEYSQSGEFIQEAYKINQINPNSYLLLTQKSGTKIKPGGEVARVQTLVGSVEDFKSKLMEIKARVSA